MYQTLLQAEKLSNEKTKIIVKWSKIENKGIPSYKDFMDHSFFCK